MESKAWNELVWHANQRGDQGDMDTTLALLRQMDSLGVQPDLALLDTQVFTFLPRSG